MKKRLVATTLALGLALATHAEAAFITSAADPTLAGGTVVDFDALANQTGSSISTGGVSLAGNQTVRVDNSYIGQYNSRGVKYFDNGAGDSNVITITFGATVSAFGFLWGAADVDWTLKSYNAANVLIEQHVVSPTDGSNAGEFFGIAAAGIAKAELASSDGQGDWVFLDNLTFVAGAVAVPEPATLALFGAALLGLAGVRRRAGASRA